MSEPTYAGSGMGILIALGFNKSGMDAGELDFGIAVGRVLDLDDEQRKRLLELLDRVSDEVIKLRVKKP